MKNQKSQKGIVSSVSLLFAFTIIVGSFFLFSKVEAASGINPELTYFGVLQNSKGNNAADGNYDMVFRIYTAATGGTPVWTGNYTTANNNPVSVKDGNFTVLLGSGSGNALNIDFSQDTYYVGITVGTDAEMTPRQRIGAAAYAFNANAVNGTSIYQGTGDPNGVQTGSVGDMALDASNDKLYIKTSGTDTNTGWSEVVGSGGVVTLSALNDTNIASPATNDVLVYKGSQWANQAPGSITTSTPGLTVTGGGGSVLGSGVSIDIASASGTQAGLLTTSEYNTFNNKQNALTFGDLITSTPGLTITGGTGTVVGGNADINIATANGTASGLLSSSDWQAFTNKVSSQWVTSGSTISFNGGSVGIGTASPVSALDVAGTAQLHGAAGKTGLYVDDLGNVGINTNSPGANLEVNGNSQLDGYAKIGLTNPITFPAIGSAYGAGKVLMDDGTGQITLQSLPGQVGKIISGYITTQPVNASAYQWSVTVGPNTKVQTYSGFGTSSDQAAIINVTAGTFNFTLPNTSSLNMYISYSGAVSFGIKSPSGGGAIIASLENWITSGSTMLPFYSVLPDNRLFGYPSGNFDPTESQFDVTTFGADKTGTKDSSQAFGLATLAAERSGNTATVVYIPAGTYTLSTYGTPVDDTGAGWWNANSSPSHVYWKGQEKNDTIINFAPSSGQSINMSHFEDMTWNLNGNVNFYDYGLDSNTPVIFKNVAFNITGGSGSEYFLEYGVNTDPIMSMDIDNCTFNFDSLYIPIYVGSGASDYIKIIGNTFKGNASHQIRIEPYEIQKGVDIENNNISGGTTGIFLAGSRTGLFEHPVISNNDLSDINEEAISMDGFGNNAGLCPVISNGAITSVSNDSNGRLVIGANMLYVDGNGDINQPSPVSLRNDWTNFYFAFEDGTGLEGTIAKIVSTDSTANTYTLDLYTPASKVSVGGEVGVESGFFSPVIENNTITGAVGSGNSYATAISAYLNVFGALIEGNKISGCANGLDLSGGLMLSTYHTLAYDNVVQDNVFMQVAQVSPSTGSGVAIQSLYSTAFNQYGNKFIDNTVIGGNLYFQNQQNFTLEDNDVSNATTTFSHCGNTLPTADASQIGRRFLQITDDSSGNPTSITEYMCKLSSGTYSWVPIQ